MPSRMGMVNLIAEELDIGLDLAAKLVDEHIPIEAYDEYREIPADDVQGWIDHVWAEDYIQDDGIYPESG